MLKRFLLGGVTCTMLAFLPYFLITSVSIWAFEKYDPKYSALDAWLLAINISGIIIISSFIGFTIAFPLLNRLTHEHPMWSYLITISIPVIVMYILALTGVLAWIINIFNSQPLINIISGGFIVYLAGLLCAVGFALIKSRSTHK